MPGQPVTFGAPSLEGVVALPQGVAPFPAVVVCHPHPQYGGTMRNNVVEGVCRGLEAAGIASLRFNFRGAGASQGEYTGGPGEEEDARGALAFLASYAGIDPGRVGLAGYSFGARISLNIASRQSLPAVAFIAPTTQMLSDPSAPALFRGPKLFISGERDHGVDQEVLARFVEALPEPRELLVIPHIDHFWAGAEALVGELVAGFFARVFGVNQGRALSP